MSKQNNNEKNEVTKIVNSYKNTHNWYTPTYVPQNVDINAFEERVTYDTLSTNYVCYGAEVEIIPGEKRQLSFKAFHIEQIPIQIAKDYQRMSDDEKTFSNKEIFERVNINEHNGIYFEISTGYVKQLVWETDDTVFTMFNSDEQECPVSKNDFIKVAESMQPQ